ncbi:DedA family protein [Polluticaenibacter yanchengensis]|uniref:VTT domain-containing protein n=1 Tax=Polluticaenibacter yanchengensis TaxID=3014562 RepID=A0ABT4UF26_9BACT|nr:VTT domain-containing protein [Chitinophagaceae bacterium LY-5]
MQKRFLFLLAALFSISNIFAQDSLKIHLRNQYVNVKEQVLNINGIEYTTNKEGIVNIAQPANEVILISGKNYKEQSFSVTDVKATGEVKLHKEFSFKDLLTPMFYIENGGLWLLVFIVFAETGLFAGFFLPGDSLLFVAGIYSSELAKEIPVIPTGNDVMDLIYLVILISLAGIIGNFVGYWTGRKVGKAMYSWKDSFFFKKKYLLQAEDFFKERGGSAIIIARFLPLIRTFAPIVAGIVGMERSKFTFYNIIGCVSWVFSMLFMGHFLQKILLNQFSFDLKENLEIIIIVIVAVTTLPIVMKVMKNNKKAKLEAAQQQSNQ